MQHRYFRVKIARISPNAASAPEGLGVLDFHGDMRQVGESRQPLPVMRRLAFSRGGDAEDGAKMSGPEPPEM